MRTFEELNSSCGIYCSPKSYLVNYTRCTEDFFVDCELYPKMIKELNFLVPITIALSLILLTGLLGNVSVCIVIKIHPNMRTETNVYLFSLAVSDILLLVFGLAPELWYYWQMYPYIFGEFTCRISKFLAATATWASALTVVAFSIERYIAICYQSSFRSRSKKHVPMALWAIWVISIALSLPVLHAYQVVAYSQYPPLGENVYSQLSTQCAIPKGEKYKYFSYLYKVTCVLFFFLPMVILTFMYIRIGIFVRNNRKLARKSGIQNSCSENAKAITMMVAVVVLFFLCGAPFHYQRLTTTSSEENREYERTVLMVTGLFYYASAAANPILYNIWCRRYRRAFMEIIHIGPRNKQTGNIQMGPTAQNSDGSKKSTTTTNTIIPTYTTQSSLLGK